MGNDFCITECKQHAQRLELEKNEFEITGNGIILWDLILRSY